LLEGYVEELSADPDIVYAVIFNPAGEPVTHYLNAQEPYFTGQRIRPDTFTDVLGRARSDSTLLKVQRDIDYDGARLGNVEVALSRAKILQRAQETGNASTPGTDPHRTDHRRPAAGVTGRTDSAHRMDFPPTGGKTRAVAGRQHGARAGRRHGTPAPRPRATTRSAIWRNASIA